MISVFGECRSFDGIAAHCVSHELTKSGLNVIRRNGLILFIRIWQTLTERESGWERLLLCGFYGLRPMVNGANKIAHSQWILNGVSVLCSNDCSVRKMESCCKYEIKKKNNDKHFIAMEWHTRPNQEQPGEDKKKRMANLKWAQNVERRGKNCKNDCTLCVHSAHVAMHV